MMLISCVSIETGAFKLELECRGCGHKATLLSLYPPTPEEIANMDCLQCGKIGG